MKIPKWLQKQLSESDLKKIESAVEQAELKTSGEIVPIIVRRSSTVGHVPLILFLILTSLFFGFGFFQIQSEWLSLPTWANISIDVILMIILVRLLSPLSFVERILTPKPDQILQVEQRAVSEFYHHRIHNTVQATGILIFLSVLERRAVVYGDDPIAKKIDQKTWQEVIDHIVAAMKHNNLTQGLVEAIEMSGSILTTHFPIQPDDKNELSNHLIIKE